MGLELEFGMARDGTGLDREIDKVLRSLSLLRYLTYLLA
jgi:hypothetical protein